MKRKRKKDNDYPDDRDIVEESQDVDDPPRQRVTRPDRVQRIAENKNTDCVAVKTTLNMFCKRGGRFLPGRALP
ncbi:hypothetical protein F442_22624 [Phytophthora nicotianae P10297]|uniref:Uncharacterized protein n=2 Tax=Phytophthora nicotianae TaxID=4792 RepID=W2Y031_PHYNI|nr:hypothetical protein L917_21435 [Phytophthora nicotianae]ETP28092.1 hypothetical protein F442_22624 [Phytophthora nicotianae P10297]